MFSKTKTHDRGITVYILFSSSEHRKAPFFLDIICILYFHLLQNEDLDLKVLYRITE